MRWYSELLVIALAGALAGWVARAPEEPYQRAGYLCAPVAELQDDFHRLESALWAESGVIPPAPYENIDPAGACTRLVVRLSVHAHA